VRGKGYDDGGDERRVWRRCELIASEIADIRLDDYWLHMNHLPKP